MMRRTWKAAEAVSPMRPTTRVTMLQVEDLPPIGTAK